MDEFKLHGTVNNFATYYNPKQLCWQQYQTTSNKKTNSINNVCFFYLALKCTKNGTLWLLAQKGCAPLFQNMLEITDQITTDCCDRAIV